jgi:hypothetical protein
LALKANTSDLTGLATEATNTALALKADVTALALKQYIVNWINNY